MVHAGDKQAAFIGGVEMSLPYFAGDGGICPLLENQIGRLEGGDRWQTFLTAGSRTANEFDMDCSGFRQLSSDRFPNSRGNRCRRFQ